jgi:hypothetical protein
MSDDTSERRRLSPPRFVTRRDHLLAEIHALAIELDGASADTESGRAPLAARAEYLRARRDHHRAAMMWMNSTEAEQLTLVSEALRTCRAALESSRATARS